MAHRMNPLAAAAVSVSLCSAGVLVPATSAYAISPQAAVVLAQVARQLPDIVSTDSGAGANALRVLVNGHCGWSKHDGEPRGQRLARTYRNFRAATQAGDVDSAAVAAQSFYDTVYASKMYTSCWNSMQVAVDVISLANQVIAAKQTFSTAMAPSRGAR